MQNPQWYAPPGYSGPTPEPPGAASNVHLEPGGFGIRFGARVIDGIAMTIIGAVAGGMGGLVVGVLGGVGVISDGWEARLRATSIMTFACSMLASLLYHSLSEALGGATIGKAICGLRVITEDRQPCTFGKALGRNAAYFIDALFFGAVAWSAMSKSPTKQRNGDTWAGTIVVHRAPELPERSAALGIAVGVATAVTIQAVGMIIKGI